LSLRFHHAGGKTRQRYFGAFDFTSYSGEGTAPQWNLPNNDSPVVVRPGSEKDFPAVARIQQRSPEAAQWPLGDYGRLPLLVALVDSTLVGFCFWRCTAPDEAELRSGVAGSHRRFSKRWASTRKARYFLRLLRQMPQPSPFTGVTAGSRPASARDITAMEL
jgi:hypothetical protein